jgi:hypothetical protein
MVLTEFGDGGDAVLAVVRAVDALGFGADAQALCLPLDFHLYENGVDAFESDEVDHADLLELVFVEQVLLVGAEVQKLNFVFETRRVVDLFLAFQVVYHDLVGLVFVQPHSQVLLVE